MFPRQPSHPPALGLNVAGPLVAIPERHPDDKIRRELYPTLYPRSGAAPFTLAPTEGTKGLRQQTQYPVVTGTTVMAVKFAGGVVLAGDTAASYGSTLRFKNMERLYKVNENCVVAASGEMSDYAYIREILDEITMEDFCADDGIQLKPSEVHALLSRIQYNRRSDFDPLWNSVIVGGMQNGESFLGMVGMIGTHFVDDHITTGFGNHLMRPLLREQYRPDLTKDEALQLVKRCLTVGCYRDGRTMNKYQTAICTSDGIKIGEPFALELKWDHAQYVHPTKYSPNAW